MGAGGEGELFRPPTPVPRERDPSHLQQLLLSVRNPLEALPKPVFERSGLYQLPFPGTPIFVLDPDAIREILVDRAEDFPHGHLFKRMLRPIWGKGMVIAEGPEWRWQRRAASPAFRPAGMNALAPRMRAAAEAALARWQAAGGAVHDIERESGHITFDIILDAVLSGGEDFDRATIRQRIEDFAAQLDPMRLSYFIAPDSYHRRRATRLTPASVRLREDVEKMIRRRRAAPPRGDLVDLLVGAVDPDSGRPMDDAILADNLLGFIMAGHGTSAVTLAWAIYLTSAVPPAAERVRAEVEEVTGGGPIEADHVERLTYTRQVVQETLRLYPPAPTLTRVCARTCEVAGARIRAGRRLLIPAFALQRHRGWWEHPNHFDPDRFAPDKPPPNRFLYLPFGAGPRVCIGATLAMTELVVTLGTLLRGADFRLREGHKVWPVGGLALRPQGGLPMHVQARAQRLAPVPA